MKSTEQERAEFINWHMDVCRASEISSAHVWDNHHLVALAWKAARRAPVVPPTVAQVEEAVGMAAAGWDCIEPKTIIDAVMELAAFGAPVVPQGWKPIETAPKDGTIIDLWSKHGYRCADASWGLPPHCCGEMGHLCDSDWHGYKDGWVADFFGEPELDENFTHWMPLAAAPQPPEATKPNLNCKSVQKRIAAQAEVDMVSCACGDMYPQMTFGAAWIYATGKCQNCDAAEAAPVQMPDALLTLETDAHYIFNNPPGECPQAVRDVIEWYAASVRQLLAAQEQSK